MDFQLPLSPASLLVQFPSSISLPQTSKTSYSSLLLNKSEQFELKLHMVPSNLLPHLNPCPYNQCLVIMAQTRWYSLLSFILRNYLSDFQIPSLWWILKLYSMPEYLNPGSPNSPQISLHNHPQATGNGNVSLIVFVSNVSLILSGIVSFL